MTDVLVVGGGPAGWAVASACAERGLRVALVDPRPDRPWRATYGAWAHELPADLPPTLVAAGGQGTAIAHREHRLADRYAVLDTEGLRRHLTHPAVTVHAERVVGAVPDGVALAGRAVLRASAVVDATGAAQVLSTARRRSRPAHRIVAEQTAAGVVVEDGVADRVTGGRLLFMDWRPRHGRPGWPTFLYAVPVGGGRTLLEETSLVRRPGLPLPELRDRLAARLRAGGVGPGDVLDTETVRFPVDTPDHDPPPGVVPVGAAAPVMHPASGFSVATSLRLAPAVADALVAGDVGAARRAVRSPAATVVHAMRRRGLDVLLRLPPDQVTGFFEAFFGLPEHHRRAYLDARDDVGASLAAMLALFGRLPPRLRSHLIVGSVAGPGCVRMEHDE